MMNEDFNERENTEIAELIELFEKCLSSNEQHYFDEDSLERILEYYEMRNLSDRAEAVVDYAIMQNPNSSDFLVRKAEFLLNRKNTRNHWNYWIRLTFLIHEKLTFSYSFRHLSRNK